MKRRIKFGLTMLIAVFIYYAILSYDYFLNARPDVSNAIITVTQDGQQVIFDVYTFIAMKIFQETPITEEWPGPERQKKLREEWLAKNVVPIQKFPFKIVDQIYALEYGYPKHDSQRIYLVDCGEGYVLIDPSYAEFQPMIEENLRKLGVESSQILWVLNTHCHIDHAAASLYWRKKGAKIIAPEIDSHAIESGNQITAYYLNAFGPKLFPPCPVDIKLQDADELTLGNKTFHVIFTPGHTPGSSCFFLKHAGKNILFSEDIVLYHGRFAWMDHPYADWDDYIKSIYKLKHFQYDSEKISFDFLLPGHGSMVLNNASLDIDRTIDVVENIMKEKDIAKRNTMSGNPFRHFWEKKKRSN